MEAMFLILLILCNSGIIYGFNEKRIINGVIIPQDVFPFAVKMFKHPFLFKPCSSSIISSRHVLTAAHCIPAWEIENFPTYRKELTSHYYVDPSFSGIRFEDQEYLKFHDANISYLPIKENRNPFSDIAVVEFPEGTNFNVDPITLAKDYVEEDGDEAVIVGYGRYIILNNHMKIMDEYSPNKRYGNFTIKKGNCFGTTTICGGDPFYSASFGDSGGVMMINRNEKWYQVGVMASANSQKCIATRISSYCNFIEEVTKGEAKCESIFPERQGLPTPHFDRIYRGEKTPAKLFEFVIPFYVYPDLHGCTATVISKRHLLTSAFCVSNSTSIKTNKFTSYKMISNGKYFADFRNKGFNDFFTEEPFEFNVYVPIKYGFPDRSKYNLAIIEYPEWTDFGIEPITLTKDYIQIEGEKAIVAGFGHYEIDETTHSKGSPPILLHNLVDMNIYSPDGYGDPNIWDIWITKFLQYDEGGPAIIERNGKWYQIGIGSYIENKKVSWNIEDHRVRISTYCDFIENVTQNEVKCESVYDVPVMKEETTTVSQTDSFPRIVKYTVNQNVHDASSSNRNFIAGILIFFIGTIFIMGYLNLIINFVLMQMVFLVVNAVCLFMEEVLEVVK